METTHALVNPLLSRKITNLSESIHSNSKSTFTVLQWNTLNSQLTDSFPKADPLYLTSSHRNPLLIQEIKSYSPDFVCLEEVNNLDIDLFKGIFDSTEYDCIFHGKYQGTDGLCFFYNQKRYELVKSELQTYIDLETNKKQSQVFQLNILRQKNSEGSESDYLMIIFTHLKAKEQNTEIRNQQVKQLLKFMNETKEEFLESKKGSNINLGIVVCGDFNDEPHSEPIRLFEEATKFKTAFEGEKFTTFKIRNEVKKRVIDYVFYNESLQLIGKNNIPTEELIGVNGLPNEGYPSDHLSLVCKFAFN